MPDMEKVIKGLEECVGNGNCVKCQYGKEKQALSCKKLLTDALEWIKSAKHIHTEHALYTVYEPVKRTKKRGVAWTGRRLSKDFADAQKKQFQTASDALTVAIAKKVIHGLLRMMLLKC